MKSEIPGYVIYAPAVIPSSRTQDLTLWRRIEMAVMSED